VNGERLSQARGLLLVLPLVAFVAAFFLWPLVTIFITAVSDGGVAKAFPRVAVAIEDWEDGSPPSPALLEAMALDLETSRREDVGNAVRRLNSQMSGFRSLFGRTQQALARGDGPVDLVGIDPRWGEPAYWQAIASAMNPYTDRFLLGAVDLQRDAAGRIEPMPPTESVHVTVFLRTLGISGLVTLFCLLIGLPYAMLLASTGGWVRQALLAAVLLPMWTSSLVRCTAWFIILQNNGPMNQFLINVGAVEQAIPLLFTRTGVLIAMTHFMLPFMVLSVYSVLLSLPGNLMTAAYSLGARPVRAFLNVLLPLAMPGVVSGSLLVFMMSLGFYILPALLGGGNDQLISALVAGYAIRQANWQMAAALGLILLVSTLLIYALYQRLSAHIVKV